ncbi:MAG: Cna B-type domain-containing protein [Ruminococcus sp.]|nr:Cna B-type domain-containing protein [Ruminococcus sp.]
MLDFNNKVSQFLKEHKKSVRMRALAVVMSLAVVLSVCGSLIMPAISASKEELNGGVALTALGAANNEGNASSGVTDFKYSVEWAQTSQDSESATGELAIKLTYTPAEAKTIEAGTPIVLTLNSSISNASGFLYDTDYNGGNVAGGYYEIIDGVLYIYYYQDYIDTIIKDTTKTFYTNITFSAEFNRGANDSTNQTYSIGSGANAPSITVTFNSRSTDLAKSGVYNGNGTVTWTLVVSNGEGTDLDGYVISDDMLSDMVAGSFTVDPSGVASYNNSSKNIEFSSTTAKEVTITYTTTVDDSSNASTTVTNKATLTDDPNDPGVESEATESVTIPADYSVSKSDATYDYNSGVADGKITWTITITSSSSSGDYTGLTISDSMFDADSAAQVAAALEVLGFTVTTNSDYSVSIVSTNGTKTGGSISLTYTTSVSEGDSGNNTVTVTDTDDGGKVDSTYQYYAYDAYSVYKNGEVTNYGGTTATLTWTITAEAKGTGGTLRNSVLSDEAFKDSTFVITSVTNGKDTNVSYTLNQTDGTITINDDVNKVVITYTTEVVINQNQSTQTETNTVTLNDNDTYTKVVQIGKDTISKEMNGSETIDVDATEGTTTITIPWIVEYERTAGLADKFVTDTVIENSGYGEHFIYADSSLITVTDSSGNTISSSDYTVTFYKDGAVVSGSAVKADSFIITFDDDFTETHVKIYYDTTVIANTADLPTDGTTVTYSNKVTTDNGEDTGYYNYSNNESPYKKYAVDPNTLDIIDSADLLDLTTVSETDNNVTTNYYEFGFVIEFNASSLSLPVTFTDTIDSAFTLDSWVYYSGWGNNNWDYIADSSTNLGYITASSSNENSYYITVSSAASGNNTETNFNVNNGSGNCFIYYTMKISVEDFSALVAANGGSYTVSNSAVTGSYDPVVATVDVDQGTLEKASIYNQNTNANAINYSVYLNPKSEDLDITSDTLTLYDYFTSDVPVSVSVANFTVYYYNDTSRSMEELDKKEYSYSMNTGGYTEQTEVYNETFSGTGYGNSTYTNTAQLTNLKAGDIITIDYSINPQNQYYYWFGYDLTTGSNGRWDGNIKDDSASNTSPGSFSYTLTSDYDNLFLWLGSGDGDTYTATVTVTHTESVQTEFIITVPDEMYILVEYTLILSSSSDTQATVSNTVSVESVSGVDNSTDSETMELTTTTAGLMGTGGDYIELQKVDASNYNSALTDAEFEIYRSTDGQNWYAATAFSQNLTDDGYDVTWAIDTSTSATSFKFEDVDYKLLLDNGYVYKLVEVTAPTGYTIAGDGTYYFIFNQTNTAGNYPTTAVNYVTGTLLKDVYSMASQETMYITNSQNMSVTATKVWNDGISNHDDYTVTVTLYRTTSSSGKSLTEVTTDASGTAISSTATLDSSKSWSASWSNLEGADPNGNAYYYYIYETEVSDGKNTATLSGDYTSYKLNGTDYDVTYDNNSLTTTGTIIITNTDNSITSYTLPNTGSTGVGNYLIGGGAISITALALMRIKKRKNK